ncbi:hypothetical protein TIFTF001_034273 [Ficus carica]|uniref:Uncharacterized protein n=1 Tax=Ficus carica TaxID=3494 RepID=A0AA88DZH6_FICCA|nr:hypothetical protein TIFTF001_034273 [Ficus carica]
MKKKKKNPPNTVDVSAGVPPPRRHGSLAEEFRAPRGHGSRAESNVVKIPRSELGPTAIGAATILRARSELRRRNQTNDLSSNGEFCRRRRASPDEPTSPFPAVASSSSCQI